MEKFRRIEEVRAKAEKGPAPEEALSPPISLLLIRCSNSVQSSQMSHWLPINDVVNVERLFRNRVWAKALSMFSLVGYDCFNLVS